MFKCGSYIPSQWRHLPRSSWENGWDSGPVQLSGPMNGMSSGPEFRPSSHRSFGEGYCGLPVHRKHLALTEHFQGLHRYIRDVCPGVRPIIQIGRRLWSKLNSCTILRMGKGFLWYSVVLPVLVTALKGLRKIGSLEPRGMLARPVSFWIWRSPWNLVSQ